MTMQLKSSAVSPVVRALIRTKTEGPPAFTVLMASLTMLRAVPLSVSGTASSRSKIIASAGSDVAFEIILGLFPGTKSIERKTIILAVALLLVFSYQV
ncbi:hypothetical protein ES707_09811 [subsurface metagenome]